MTGVHTPRPNATAVDAPPTIENIQALRGIAALLVVWSHLKFHIFPLCPSLEQFNAIRTNYGAIGVDLFFVISGYVICLTASKRHSRSIDFFCARIARVSPLYTVAIVLPFIGYRPDSWPPVTFCSFWNQLFYLPIFDMGSYTSPPLAVGWSLSFELWFYVVFALLLNLWPARKVASLLPLLFVVGAPLMMFYHGQWYFPRFAFHPLVLEFALGCLVYRTQNWVSSRVAWVLLFTGAFSMLAFSRESGFLGWHANLLLDHLDLAWLRVAVWGVPSAFIVAGWVGLERQRGLVLPRALVWLGGISYSLYLTHMFSMSMVMRLGLRVGLHNPILSIFTTIFVCILVGWLCCIFVEQPLTSRAQQWVKKRIHPPKP